MIKVIICSVTGVLVVVGLLATQKRHDTSWYQNECMRIEAADALKMINFRLSEAENRFDHSALEAVRSETARRFQSIAELKIRRDELIAGLDLAAAEMSKFQLDRMAESRARAIGKELPSSIELGGKFFENAKITAVDDAGVMIRHRHGAARIHFRELSDEQRVEYGLEKVSAEVMTEEERQHGLAYDAWVAEEMESARRPKSQMTQAKWQVKTPARPTAAVPAVRNGSAAGMASVSPLSVPPRQVGSGQRSSRYYRPRNTVYYYYNAPRYYIPAVRNTPPPFVFPVNRPPVISQ